MRSKILLFTSLCCMFLYGQNCRAGDIVRPNYTSKWGYLYASLAADAKAIGVFCTEASVYLLDSSAHHYQVRVSNGDVGYIHKQALSGAMMGKRSVGEPEAYFNRGSSGEQCPHVYVQASELRVRSTASVDGKIIRKAFLNDMICIDYVPLYANGWVYIGDHFHEHPEYIPYSYLGKALTFEAVLNSFHQAKNSEEAIIFADRLREIGWLSSPDVLAQSLSIWKETMVKFNQERPKVDIDLEQALAAKLRQPISNERYAQAFSALNLRFLVAGVSLVNGKTTEQQLLQAGFTQVSEVAGFPECGWDPLYFYRKGEQLFAVEDYDADRKIAQAYRLAIDANTRLFLGDQVIDDTFTEEEFVASFGQFLSVQWMQRPHEYYFLNGDAGLFILRFAGGKLIQFETMYYC